MASNFLSSVPKLLGRENYDEWAFAVENFFIIEGLSACMDGTEEDPVIVTKTKAKLVLTIDPSLFTHIKDAKTPKDVWQKLKTLYDDNGFTRKIGLLRTLISLRLETCESMESYVNQLVETAQRLRRTGFQIDDEWVGSLLLAGLPELYSPMLMAIEHSGIKITTDSIKTKLLDMQVENGGNQHCSSAFTVKFQKTKFQKKSYGGSTSRSQCPINKTIDEGSTSKSQYHTNKNKDGDNKRQIQCFKCKKLGHFMSQCPNNPKQNVFSATFFSKQFDETEWYIDSGASVHLTCCQELLKNNREPSIPEIMVANSHKISVISSGDIDLCTVVSKQKFDICIKDVQYVPELTTNLLSVSQLVKKGNRVNFHGECCQIFNKCGVLIATADLCGNVYKLNYLKSDCGSALAVQAGIWHRRFGHLNYSDLRTMQCKEVVEGLKCSGNLSKTEVCEVCCEGKQTRLPFSNQGKRSTSLLEIIHADLCGPMEKTSIGGSKYFLIFQDDFSRMVFVYFLKSKNETFECFQKFKTLVETQKSKAIKVLRTDNGGEFCSKEFESYLEKFGIVHQKTNPFTPEQNGMVERMNRTLIEKARCLLFDANLSKAFWAEAVNTAVYLRNRSVVSGLVFKTPYELWTNTKPDVSHLRIFGSEVMVHIPQEKRRKWDKKSNKMLLLGFCENVKGYRVYDPSTRNVTTSRDVTVIEKINQNMALSNGPDSSETPVSVGEINNKQVEPLTRGENVVSVPVVQRRSERIPKPVSYPDYVTYACSGNNDLDSDPISVSEAMSRPDHAAWKQSMEEEMKSFYENDAWDLVTVPKSASVVSCKWVFKRKSDGENNVRYRSRLVARGFTQRFGIDYFDTFSPVIRYSTFRFLMAISVNLGLDIFHLDVTTAFLNGKLEEDVFMNQPEGFTVVGQEEKVLKLNRAIYGLKQSSRVWYQKVDVVLNNLGYKKSDLEPCLFIKRQQSKITIIALYVDDFFIFSNDEIETNILRKELAIKFKIKDLGRAKQCLGLNINISKDKKRITIDQEHYINQLLKDFEMVDCKTTKTPMECNLQLLKCGKNDFKAPYQQLIGSLMFLATMTRPDISYAVSYLSQFNNSYDQIHWKSAKRVLKYLKETSNYCLNYEKGSDELVGFVDADWGSDSVDRRSYTGFCFKLSDSLISWGSTKQKTVALSSTEAEYIAISEASKEATYLRNLMRELLGSLKKITIYNDNQGALKLTENPIFHKRTKHIDIRHHFVREKIVNNEICLNYLPTEDMPADVLTKPLIASKHYKFLDALGIMPKLQHM